MRAQVSCWNGSVTDRRMPAALRQLSCMGHPPGLAGRNIKSPRSRNSGVMPLQVCFPGFSAIRDMIPSARSAYWKNRIVHKMASGLLHKQPTSYKCAYDRWPYLSINGSRTIQVLYLRELWLYEPLPLYKTNQGTEYRIHHSPFRPVYLFQPVA